MMLFTSGCEKNSDFNKNETAENSISIGLKNELIEVEKEIPSYSSINLRNDSKTEKINSIRILTEAYLNKFSTIPIKSKYLRFKGYKMTSIERNYSFQIDYNDELSIIINAGNALEKFDKQSNFNKKEISNASFIDVNIDYIESTSNLLVSLTVIIPILVKDDKSNEFFFKDLGIEINPIKISIHENEIILGTLLTNEFVNQYICINDWSPSQTTIDEWNQFFCEDNVIFEDFITYWDGALYAIEWLAYVINGNFPHANDGNPINDNEDYYVDLVEIVTTAGPIGPGGTCNPSMWYGQNINKIFTEEEISEYACEMFSFPIENIPENYALVWASAKLVEIPNCGVDAIEGPPVYSWQITYTYDIPVGCEVLCCI